MGRNFCLCVPEDRCSETSYKVWVVSVNFRLRVKLLYKLLCGYRCISHYCCRKFFYLFIFLTTFCWSASFLTGEWSLHWFSFLSSPNVIFQVFFWNEIIDYLKIILPFSHNSPSSLMTKLPLMSHFILFYFFWWKSLLAL